MRDWTGGPWQNVEDKRVREFCGRVDWFLRDLSRGMGRIQNGQVPDGSGDPLGGGGVTVPNEVGSVLFVGPGPVLDTDGSNFYYDDANNRLGLNTGSPAARLHVVGDPATDIAVSADIASYNGGWGLYNDSGTPPATYTAALLADDGDLAYTARNAPSGAATFGFDVTVGGTLTALATYDVVFKAKKIGTPETNNTGITFTLRDSAGAGTLSSTFNTSVLTSSWVEYSVSVTLTGGAAGATANSVRVDTAFSGFNADYVAIGYLVVRVSGAGSAGKTSIFQAASGQAATLSEWQNSSGTALVDVTAAGQLTVESGGTFKHVPGAAASALLTSSATGVASWTTPSLLSLSHGDTLAGVVAPGDIIYGNATPKWARLAKGNNGEVLTLSSGLPAWAALGTLTGDFADNAFTIHDDGNSAKKMVFQLSGLTATTRTLTPQDASYIIAGTNIANTFTTGQTIQPATNVQGFTLDGSNISSAAIMNVSSTGTDLFQIAADGSVNQVQLILHTNTIGGGASFAISDFGPIVSTARTCQVPDASGTMVTRVSGANIGTNRVPFWNNTNPTGQLASSSTFTYTTGTSTLSVTNVAVVTGITSYKSVTTVRAGVPSLVATSTLTAQSAAIGATTIYAVPAAGAGMYRISWVASVTTAASVSSVLGGTNGFQVIYTDPTDSVVKTSNPTTVTAHTSAGNTTATTVSGVLIAKCKLSTNLQYSFDYTSTGGTVMVYDLDIAVEFLG